MIKYGDPESYGLFSDMLTAKEAYELHMEGHDRLFPSPAVYESEPFDVTLEPYVDDMLDHLVGLVLNDTEVFNMTGQRADLNLDRISLRSRDALLDVIIGIFDEAVTLPVVWEKKND